MGFEKLISSPHSLLVAPIFLASFLSYHSLWFVEIFVKGYRLKLFFGESHYQGGKKYCRRCEIYLVHDGTLCPCCGMALRATPTARKDKEKLRLFLQRPVNAVYL
jgi:hypothetical protein